MTELERFRQDCQAFFETLNPERFKPMVFGDGQSHYPRLMLIGEAPGEQEALQSRPFVGKAGKNLNQFLKVVGLKREEIYISNVVKIRPSKVSAAGRIVNRPPNREEKALFTPWLMREIAIVRPRALVTLGNVALQAFLNEVIGNCHGRWNEVDIAPPDQEGFTLPLFALYHPASVIYNQSLKSTYEADLLALAQSLSDAKDGEIDI